MKLLDMLVNGFIDTFGITHPEAGEKKTATRVIVAMILGTILFVAIIFAAVLYFISR